MIYLLLATLCSSSIAIIFKYSEMNNCNRYVVSTFNYLTASIISFIMVLKSGIPIIMSVSNPIQAVIGNITGNITPQGSYAFSIGLGIITGVLYLAGFLLYQISINNCGASLAGMFSKMGIIVPMIFSIFIWNEYPTLIKWIGIILMMSSIIIVNSSSSDKSSGNMKWSLILLLLITGFSDLTNKLFQKYALVEYKNHLLLFIFASALIISLILLLKNADGKFNFRSVICGVCVGVPNMLTTFFIIEALIRLQATIVYPSFSAGTIALIIVLSILIYKEKLKKKEIFAIAITLIGVVLVNL